MEPGGERYDALMQRREFFRAAAAAGAPALARASEMRGQIRITGLETDLLRFPARHPYYDAIHTFGTEGGGVVLRVLTDAGITGWAYSSFGTIAGGPKVVQTILETEVKPVLAGQDPGFPKRLRADLWKALEYHGVQGVVQFAIAAAEIAVWDILGKAAHLRGAGDGGKGPPGDGGRQPGLPRERGYPPRPGVPGDGLLLVRRAARAAR